MVRDDIDDLEKSLTAAQRYLDISSTHIGADDLSRQRHFGAIGAAKAELRKARAIVTKRAA